jgi:DNA-binding transcriptional LysR family regulator
MDIRGLDWSLLQSFLRVAQEGSLSAAARRHGLSQPTLGRHMRALEQALGQPLLKPALRGQVLTPLGSALLDHLRAMDEAAARAALVASGRQTGLAGSVRVTAARVVAQYHLPPILAALRRDLPEIQIDLIASDQPENLLYREADIALRMFRPETGDLVAQKLADLDLGLYAATSYLERRGRPRTPEELMQLDFAGFDRSDLMIRLMADQGFAVSRDFFGLRCDDQLVNWALVRAGGGVGGFQCALADRDPLVERIARFVTLPKLPLWIVTPAALRDVPRIARVRAALVQGLSAL